nr:RuBisCO long chain, Form III-b [uncultured archaeon]
MVRTEWYTEFVDENYTPSKNDLVALFYFEPAAGMSKEEAVGRIASESSTGTWTTLFKLPPRMKKLMAKAYEIRGNYVKIAYPLDLWEEGNAPQLLSGIAGNIFGMKALNNLRLLDVAFPSKYLASFPGPRHGMTGIRSMMKVQKRPLFGAVPKPKVGFTAAEHAQIGYETWMGGFDLVKDDENLTSQNFNRFEERVKLMTRLRNRAERETGERKDALINITAETNEMQKRAKLLHDNGWRFAMIDVVVAGTAATQTLREVLGDYGMAIHAHRAMHASFDRNPKHGMTMHFLAKLMRLIGVDQIHAGTAVGKLVGGVSEVQLNAAVLRERHVKPVANQLLAQDWGSIKPIFPVSSGGLHPGLIPEVMRILGNECVILVSGGIHGHPRGTRAGAIASMQAKKAQRTGAGS